MIESDLAAFRDRRPAESIRSDGAQESRAVDPDPAAGTYPEELGGISVYADTSLTIPGDSDPPAECGTWGPQTFCKSCGEPHFGPRKCERRECRDCELKWRLDRAGAATERLAGARRAGDGAEKRLVHAVASPPDPTADETAERERVRTLTDWERGKKKAYTLAKEKGVRGGVMVPHGWRVKSVAKRFYRELKGAGEIPDERGIWEWVRERPEDWRTLTFWSPHYHIIGLAENVAESDPVADDGWIFKRIDHEGRSAFPRFCLTDEETYRPMFRAMTYLLSHAGIEPEAGKQAIRWFGSLSPGRHGISLDEELTDWERSIIARKVESLGVKSESQDPSICQEPACEGSRAPIWSAGNALADPGWCDEIGRETEARLATAFEWAIGDVMPPPGLKYPSSETECMEAFEAIR